MDKKQAIYFVCGIVAISLLCLTVIFPAIDKRRRHPRVVEEEGTIVQQKVEARQAERPQETKSVSGAVEDGTAVQQKDMALHQTRQRLRGGMLLRVYRVRFAQKTLQVWTYEMPDGKLEQYQVAGVE